MLLALLICAAAIYSSVELAFGARSLRRIEDERPEMDGEPPTISIIAAARNEEAGLERAITSMLRLDYPSYEIVIVDDRSTDNTPAVLERMSLAGRLRVLRVDELPRGWLGKNHALHVGAGAAEGELLLFTDADVVFDPTLLRRAIGAMRRRGLDHVTITPLLRVPGLLSRLAIGKFLMILSLMTRPWKVRDPNSRYHWGVGAFNLVPRTVYDAIGGHRSIRMRPDDDLKLGKLIKDAGYRQELFLGRELLTVDWYPSLGALARGLRKNSFAVVDYRVAVAATAILGVLLLEVWPVVAVAVTTGACRLVYGYTVLVLMASYAHHTWLHAGRWWLAPAYFVGTLIVAYITTAAVVSTLLRGGIEWRGTRYSLDELRSNRV